MQVSDFNSTIIHWTKFLLWFKKNPNEDTEWNDQLRRYNIIDPKEEIKTIEEREEIDRGKYRSGNLKWRKNSFPIAKQLEQKSLDELDELEDEEEERVLQEYR